MLLLAPVDVLNDLLLKFFSAETIKYFVWPLIQIGLVVTLVALWDGKDEGDAPGGTAHMVRLARDVGTVNITIIDAGSLLE